MGVKIHELELHVINIDESQKHNVKHEKRSEGWVYYDVIKMISIVTVRVPVVYRRQTGNSEGREGTIYSGVRCDSFMATKLSHPTMVHVFPKSLQGAPVVVLKYVLEFFYILHF